MSNIKMFFKTIALNLLLLLRLSQVATLEGAHGGHGDHRVYFVPTLKDAASVADLIFGQPHFT
jgi:hypothetical protein